MPDRKPEADYRLRHRLHEIIFEADTPIGKLFDVVLILSIIISVIVVMHAGQCYCPEYSIWEIISFP